MLGVRLGVRRRAPPVRDAANWRKTQCPRASFGLTFRNVFPPLMVRSNSCPVPVANTAAAFPVGAIAAVEDSVAGTATGFQRTPPSVLRRTVGTCPLQIAHSAVGEAAETVAVEVGQGTGRLTNRAPRSEDAHRCALPAAEGVEGAAIQTDAPLAVMLTVGFTEMNGSGTTVHRPVDAPNR